jgi:hypothetical protein
MFMGDRIKPWGSCCHSCKIAVLNSSIYWHFGLRWLIFRPRKSHTCSIGFICYIELWWLLHWLWSMLHRIVMNVTRIVKYITSKNHHRNWKIIFMWCQKHEITLRSRHFIYFNCIYIKLLCNKHAFFSMILSCFYAIISLRIVGNACTKSGSSRFSRFSGCWLIVSVCIYLWVLTVPLEDCSEFGNFVITLILRIH